MKHNIFRNAVALVLSMTMVSTVVFGVMVTALFTTGATYAAPAQILETEDPLPMMAFEDEELKLFGFNDIPQVVDTHIAPFPFVSNPVWSPDGNWLAYLRTGANGNELMLTDIFGRTPQIIATGLNSGMPIQFSDDNTKLIYTIISAPDQATSTTGLYIVDVMSQTLSSTAPGIKLGTYEQASCGGGGSPAVYDILYWTEAGAGGIRPILTITEFGIVHSVTCHGMGVAILDTTTGIDTPLDNDITHVSLSPDGNSLLGIKNNRVMIIDLATEQLTTFTVEASPDQVMWGAPNTGNIFYSVRTVTDEIISYSPDAQEKILNETGLAISSMAVNHVAIHRFNLETGNDEIVYDNTAYAIGHMALLPDNRVLMVSEVPSLPEWFEAILDADSGNAPQLQTTLYLVSLEGAETRLLGKGLLEARLNDDEYVRQFGIRPELTAQPTTVSSGAQITLTGRNYPPQSRVLVYLGIDANTLDSTAYAAGFTNPLGEITLAFNLPAKRENGQAIANGQLLLVAKSSDGLFSAQTQVTVNNNIATHTPVVPVITRVPSNPNVPSTPYVPASISISPDRGTVGTQININGRNFPANKRVNIHLGSITSLTGNAVYASAYSDSKGNVSLTFNMPGVYANGTVIQASQILIVAATDDFGSSSALFFNFTPITRPIVVPSISLSPTSIKVKNTLTVSGQNFQANQLVNLLMGPNVNDLRGNYRTVTTDANGNFTTSFAMPERWRDGSKIKGKQVVVIGAPHPSGTWSNVANLGIEERKNNNNKPTPTATLIPTEVFPTDEPTVEVPTDEPTIEPTDQPTVEPTDEPTVEVPTDEPTVEPTDEPTVEIPTYEPIDDDLAIPYKPVTPEPVIQQQPTPEPLVEEPVVQEPAPVVQNPSIQVTPNIVNIGGSLKVSGKHFPANVVLTVRLSGEVNTSLGVVNSDGNGSFTANLLVPLQIEDSQMMVEGNYQLVVGNSDISTSTAITISG